MYAEEGEADSGEAYLACVRHTLSAALCLQDFPSMDVERQNRPEVEMKKNPHLLLNPMLICRNAHERCLIEGSINSTRVSMKFHQSDELDGLLLSRFLTFLSSRAESLHIVRRKPLHGYDLSFLITSDHCEQYMRDRLVDFIVKFMEDMQCEVEELRHLMMARGRSVAAEYLRQFVS